MACDFDDREGESPSPMEPRLGRMFHSSATGRRREQNSSRRAPPSSSSTEAQLTLKRRLTTWWQDLPARCKNKGGCHDRDTDTQGGPAGTAAEEAASRAVQHPVLVRLPDLAAAHPDAPGRRYRRDC